MPDVWSEIMSARLARREVTRRHADAAMGKAVIAPVSVSAPTPPVKETKPESVKTEVEAEVEVEEEKVVTTTPKTPKKSTVTPVSE